MKVVTLSIACKDEDAEFIATLMNDSDTAQLGLYTLGTDTRNPSDEEMYELASQLPEDLFPEEE